jgi:photosystem II stability/assembly factor-like uncharacterized protein
VVLKSTDDGMRWTLAKAGVANSGGLEAIATRDGVRVLAVGFGRALLSEDGGAAWSNGILPNAALNRTLKALVLGGGDTAFAAGENGLLLRSSDLGRTWTAQESGTAANLSALAAAGPRTLFAAGDSGVLLRSIDRGSTWIRMDMGSIKSVRSLHFLDERTGFAARDSGQVARTADGGATWISAQVEQWWNPIHMVFALDDRTILAGGYNGTLFRSEDGGAKWTQDTTRLDYVHLHALARARRGTVLAVGEHGAILSMGADPSDIQPRRARAASGATTAKRLRIVIGGRRPDPASGLRTLEGRAVGESAARAGTGAGIYVEE